MRDAMNVSHRSISYINVDEEKRAIRVYGTRAGIRGVVGKRSLYSQCLQLVEFFDSQRNVTAIGNS